MIVITTPTGQIGSKLVADLLVSGARLRLITRDASQLSQDVRQRVEVVQGSHGDARVLDRALAGADALFWLVPPDPSKTMEAAYLEFTRPAAAAIRRHGVARVVAVTALGRGTAWHDRAGLVTASLAMEDILIESGAAFCGLAMPSFMENTMRQVAVMKDKGAFFGPINPDHELPFTATRDMSTAAARVLTANAWSGRLELPVLGPEDLSFNDQAAIISEVTGHRVRYQQISFDQFKQQALGRGATESFAQGYVDMYRAKDEGMDNVAARAADTRYTTTFRQFCEEQLKPALRPSPH